jgi:hypothetical protein
MQVCAADHELSYLTSSKMQLVSCSVVGLTTAKFKPLILPTHCFSLFNAIRITSAYALHNSVM